MDCGLEKLGWFIKAIIIKITVDPVTFVFMEICKFVFVLALAFWITVGIFLMWESIMPETARRLSAAAAAVVANSAGLLPEDENKDIVNEQGNYPYVVDLPNAAPSAMETNAKDELSPSEKPELESLLTDSPNQEALSSESPKEGPANETLPDPLPKEPSKESPSSSENRPDELKSPQEETTIEGTEPVATSTPKNSIAEAAQGETAVVADEHQAEEKPTEAAE